MDDRFGHQFHERYARPVVIDKTSVTSVLRTCSVLFQMNAGKRDACERSAGNERILILTDLVPLRDIGIEVLFTIKFSKCRKRSSHGKTNLEHMLHCFLINDGQRSRMGETYRTNMSVRLSSMRIVY